MSHDAFSQRRSISLQYRISILRSDLKETSKRTWRRCFTFTSQVIASTYMACLVFLFVTHPDGFMVSTQRIHSLSWDWQPPQQTRTATSARSKQSIPLCAPHIGSARSPPRSHSPEPNSPATFFAPPAATSGNTFTCAVGAHTRSVTRSMRCLTRRVGSYQRENPSGANSFFFSLLTYAYGLSESCTVLSAAPGDDINYNWRA